MRIRHPTAMAGTPIGVQEAARKYGIPAKTVSSWASREEVYVLARPERKGHQLLLDELSLQKRIKVYTPHRDSSSRRLRRRNLPAPPTAQPLSPPHRVEGMASLARMTNGRHTPQGLSLPGAPTAVVVSGSGWGLPSGSPPTSRLRLRPTVPVLVTSDLVERFLEDKRLARRSPETLVTLTSQLKPFVAAFPYLPMERRIILDYVRRYPGSPRTLRNHHETLRNFYRWVGRELDIPVPSLDRPDLPRNTARPHYLGYEEIARVLGATRTPVERAIVIALTQTAARRGELASLTRETMHDNWAVVNGKMGERILYIPDESMHALIFAMAGRDRLYTRGGSLTVLSLSATTKRLLVRAGVYKKGMGDHVFRHSYQGEYLANGGPEVLMHQIMGHVRSGDKTQLYLHADPEVMKAAMQYAPRRFLQLAMEMPKPQEVTV